MFINFEGIFFVIPCTDSYKKVDLRTVSFDVPPQEVADDDHDDYHDDDDDSHDVDYHDDTNEDEFDFVV